jgi:hypothetical protein
VDVLSYIRGENPDALRKVINTLKNYDGEVITDVVMLQHDNLYLEVQRSPCYHPECCNYKTRVNNVIKYLTGGSYELDIRFLN